MKYIVTICVSKNPPINWYATLCGFLFFCLICRAIFNSVLFRYHLFIPAIYAPFCFILLLFVYFLLFCVFVCVLLSSSDRFISNIEMPYKIQIYFIFNIQLNVLYAQFYVSEHISRFIQWARRLVEC